MRTMSKLLLSTLVMAAAMGPGAAAAAARDDLKAFTAGLKGLDGQFSQQVFDANGKRKESSTGRVALSAPRLFRWEYVKPYAQLIVADGKSVWVYDPDLQQVTKRAQGAAEQNSPLTALIDPARLEKDYAISEAGEAEGLEWLTLNPKGNGDTGFKSARLGFGKGGLERMQVIDALGQRTVISFAGWKRNPGFAADTFRYVPAKGVDVVSGG